MKPCLSGILLAMALPMAMWACDPTESDDGDAAADDTESATETGTGPEIDPAAAFAVMELFTSEG